jgi:epsin
MDFDSIRNKVQNLTLYDIKAGVRQVQNGMSQWVELSDIADGTQPS